MEFEKDPDLLLSSLLPTFRAWYIDHSTEKRQHRLFGMEYFPFSFQGDRWRVGEWAGELAER